VHLLLALVLTLFLALQVKSLGFVLRGYRARGTPRRPRSTEVLWTTIPVIVVLLLAARSWVAVFDVPRPAVASAVTEARPGVAPPALTAPSRQPERSP
jgi:heme/copper-type cytochrome/quinol oxidase subunit 2